jgi:hypothetical protein
MRAPTSTPGSFPMTSPAAYAPLPMPRRLSGPAAVAAGAGLGAALLAVRDPHAAGSYGYCPFRAVTGLPCPLCGGLRAVADLTHGQVHAALLSNALVVAGLVAATGLWAAWTVRRVRGSGAEEPPLRSSPWLGRVVAVAALLFCLLRWLPGFAALRPA